MSDVTDLIVEATGCSSEDAAVIEELMRVESPILGNLGRNKFMREARIGKAQMILLAKDDPETLDFYRACAVRARRKVPDLRAKDEA